MATYFRSSSNNKDEIPTIYARDPTYNSYPETPGLLDNMVYLNHSSTATSYSDTLAGSSQLQHNSVDLPSLGAFDSNPSQQRTTSDVFGSHIDDQVYSVWKDGRNEMSASAGPDHVHSNPSQFGVTAPTGTTPSSKYLKAAQDLLDEVVNVQNALKQGESAKHQSIRGSNNSGALPPNTGTSNLPESSSNPMTELLPAARQDLQNKMSKLLSMEDEVDRRYKQYYHQMRIVVSSFDLIAGCGSSKRYTALALQVISRHFRCLRDAISGQIKATHRSLGEQDTGENGSGVGISRLRFVDQKLKQQRTLHQFGMMQHAWRPQRGLPESAVSVLRAWLFEHFLHPYPKDSDKTMLARQAGLTRSQVSNWFINARVRLWKPMVEEMYKEEICDTEAEANSSPDNTIKAARNDTRVSGDGGEVLLQNTKSATTENCQPGLFHEPKSSLVPDIVKMSGPTAGANFQDGAYGEDDTDYMGIKSRGNQKSSAIESNLLKDMIFQSDGSGNGRFIATSTGYQFNEFGRLGSGGGVSLTLGLQHCDAGVVPISGRTDHNYTTIRGDKKYDPEVSSMEPNMTDYECEDTGYRQHRFDSSHMLHDFVP